MHLNSGLRFALKPVKRSKKKYESSDSDCIVDPVEKQSNNSTVLFSYNQNTKEVLNMKINNSDGKNVQESNIELTPSSG